MNKRVIVVEKDRGVFLGNYSGIAIFSKNDVLESTKAYGFLNKKEATRFVKEYLPALKNTVEYIEIPTEGMMYVDIVDIIKAGYPHYAEDMFLNMPTQQTIH